MQKHPTGILIRPAIFDGLPQVFAAFTTRRFARPSREDAESRARALARREGFWGTAFTQQVHGVRVAHVTQDGILPDHDGLTTDRHGLLLGTVAADCALVLLADVAAGVVGTCHAGWRGAVGGIPEITVREMASRGAEPDRIRGYVAPCISADAFEVGDEVARQFNPRHVHRREEWVRPHVDLRGAVVAQLLAQGVQEGNLEVSDACTFSDGDRFHSYRRESGTAGRMLGLIGLRQTREH